MGFTKYINYKKKIIDDLLASDNIIKLITNPSANCLTTPLTLTTLEKKALHYKRIFEYKFIPGVSKNVENYITMSFGDIDGTNTFMKNGDVYFYILCHEINLKTDTGLRYDLIANEIDNIFNEEENGEMKFVSMRELNGMFDGYVGVYLVYHYERF